MEKTKNLPEDTNWDQVIKEDNQISIMQGNVRGMS